jgi:2-polyprenyl-3-methyl-5-hydroxy-6-metoxy-1,4-benzoquinol methylase
MGEPQRIASYTSPRLDVIALIPQAAKQILDLGCANGRLGATIKASRDAEIVGIEADPGFADQAETNLDRVIIDRAENAARLLLGERFDVIVCADVLEHLEHPEATLGSLHTLLTTSGCVVVSLPNVRFYDTFVQLGLRGTWPRRERGIHDRTHLRWFTDRDAREMFRLAGFEVERASTNYRLVERPRRINVLAHAVARGPLRGFLAYQHLYRLVPAQSPTCSAPEKARRR